MLGQIELKKVFDIQSQKIRGTIGLNSIMST